MAADPVKQMQLVTDKEVADFNEIRTIIRSKMQQHDKAHRALLVELDTLHNAIVTMRQQAVGSIRDRTARENAYKSVSAQTAQFDKTLEKLKTLIDNYGTGRDFQQLKNIDSSMDGLVARIHSVPTGKAQRWFRRTAQLSGRIANIGKEVPANYGVVKSLARQALVNCKNLYAEHKQIIAGLAKFKQQIESGGKVLKDIDFKRKYSSAA